MIKGRALQGTRGFPEDILLNVLREHSGGISEYDMLRHLRDGNVAGFLECEFHNRLFMFRAHFLLFHYLYVLRDRLRAEASGDLIIHCLDIRLLPPSPGNPGTVPDTVDPLRAYYMDLSHLENTTGKDVDAMLEKFWTRFQLRAHREEHLTVLGLEKTVSTTDIRRRYRELALRHHPDRGGDPRRFRMISEAASSLLP